MTVLVGVSACACPFLVMWSWWTFLKARDTAEAAARASLALTVVTVAGLTVVAARHLDAFCPAPCREHAVAGGRQYGFNELDGHRIVVDREHCN